MSLTNQMHGPSNPKLTRDQRFILKRNYIMSLETFHRFVDQIRSNNLNEDQSLSTEVVVNQHCTLRITS